MKLNTPISLKIGIFLRDTTNEAPSYSPDSVETSNLLRETIILLSLPVMWVPLDLNAFGVACLFDSYNREQ